MREWVATSGRTASDFVREEQARQKVMLAAEANAAAKDAASAAAR